MDYKNIWLSNSNLSWCVLVTTGRTGTDFFQSLLDGHPEIYVFNGSLYFHTFWQEALSVCRGIDINLSDLIDEFIGNHLIAFKSRYDPSERKDQLGEEKNECIDIDTAQFKKHVLGLLSDEVITSRSVLTAIYIAYEMCLERDIGRKKVFFHHVHHVRKVDDYMKDFPNSKIICMTRDPRALYVSGVENWRRHQEEADHPSFPQYILWRAVDESLPLDIYNDGRLAMLKLEDLSREETLHAFCGWLGITYDNCMVRSTWSGKRWWGDVISENSIKESERGFSKTIVSNNWEQRLNRLERAVLNYLLIDVLDWYGYPGQRKEGFLWGVVFALAILLPTGYERRYLSKKFLFEACKELNARKFIAAFYHPIRRVIWFYKLFGRRNCKNFQMFPILGGQPSKVTIQKRQ